MGVSCWAKDRVLFADVSDPWLVGFGIASLLLVLGATSGLVNARFWISEPLVCLAFGVAIGPLGFGLLRLDPLNDPVAHDFLREAARVTLAIAVLAGAIRLPPRWIRAHWRGMAVALGPGMLLMWAAGSAVAYFCFHLPWLVSVLLGAICAPTDPVLSAPVISGVLARRCVPRDLRHAINAESGINDGLANPIVMLPLIAMTTLQVYGPGHTLRDWALQAIVWEIGTAVVLGAAGGYAAGLLMRWATRQAGSDRSSLLTIALALALATLAGLHLIGGNGVLAAFVGGAMVNNAYDQEYQEHQEHFNEAITRFFDLPIIILLGVAAPWQAWIAMGWHAAWFVGGILLLRRIPAWLLLRRWMPWARGLRENLFAGWFGPVGAAAMFYALEAQDISGLTTLWPIVSLAAFASVVVHGITGTPFSAWLGKRVPQDAVPGMARTAIATTTSLPVIRLAPLAAVPVAPALHYLLGMSAIWVFLAALIGIGVLADWIRRATDEMAMHTGPAVGGLLSVSLGSVAELVLALAVLAQGQVAVVHAQITGSIIGTSLLGLGLAIVAGGVTRERQTFKRERAGLLSSLLILVLIVLLLPAVFDFTTRHVTPVGDVDTVDEHLSVLVSCVLLLLYGGNLIFTLVTHRDVFATGEAEPREGAWPVWQCLGVLAVATAGAALESELISGALNEAASTLSLPASFLGVIVLALVGNVAELFSAVWFARQDRLGLVMSICIGSAIQVALVVAPLLVLLSLLIGSPMTLVFKNPLDLFAIAGTAFIVNAIAGDGETTWFEGVLLIGVYMVFAIAFYFA